MLDLLRVPFLHPLDNQGSADHLGGSGDVDEERFVLDRRD